MLTPETAIALLERALEEEIGLGFRTNDVRQAQRIIYDTRKAHGDPRLMDLSLFWPAPLEGQPRDELWILKKGLEL